MNARDFFFLCGLAACSQPKTATRTEYVPALDDAPRPAAPPPSAEPSVPPAPTPPEPREMIAMPGPDAAAPSPFINPSDCYCAVGGEWPVLCAAAQVPRCSCLSNYGQACREHPKADGTCASGHESFGGPNKKSGETCTGWTIDLDGKEKFAGDGRLSCSVCYTPKAVRGIATGSPCSGIAEDGQKRSGAYVCGKGVPEPPRLGPPVSPALTNPGQL